jgi:hypothetical protein
MPNNDICHFLFVKPPYALHKIILTDMQHENSIAKKRCVAVTFLEAKNLD